MLSRWTKKDCQQRLAEFCDESNGVYHLARNHADVGGLRLDYNPTYGGAIIEQVVANFQRDGNVITIGFGVAHPFGEQRLKPWEFCVALNMMRRAAFPYDKRNKHCIKHSDKLATHEANWWGAGGSVVLRKYLCFDCAREVANNLITDPEFSIYPL